MTISQPGKISKFNLQKKRISTQCVCCGGYSLKSSPAILMPFVAHRVFNWAPVAIDESWGLSTIQNGNAYSICNSLYCEDCGLLFLDIRFSDDELNRLYDNYRGQEYNILREHYEPGYTLRNDKLNAGIDYIAEIEKFIEPFLKFPLTILDWGGDTGKNTPFKNNNDALHIYDISNKRLISGAINVTKEMALSRVYGLIVCSNVIEHVPYPLNLLIDIAFAMDKDSVLYLETPLEDVTLNNCGNLHLKKKHWHEHINFYSERSLRSLVENAGLEVIGLKVIKATAGGRSSHLFQLACKK